MRAQIAILDYGSQYSQLIVRRVRELGYFAKLYPPTELANLEKPAAVILSGGPRSVSEVDAPTVDFDTLMALDVPVLGVCYGLQLMNILHGGKVAPGHVSEYGPAQLLIEDDSNLFHKVNNDTQIWMSHTDTVTELPEGCKVLARNAEGTPIALQWRERVFGIQFHPEVTHTQEGTKVLSNFLDMVEEEPAFSMEAFKQELIDSIHETVGDREVVCGVSGGVDSTVLAVLLKRAGVKLRPIFVDTGLLRKDESAEVMSQFETLGIQVKLIDASQRFLDRLEDVTDPEEKRKRIGDMFLDVFFDHAGEVELFAQGTLYPDVIESATSGSSASRIKTHHNRVDRVLELHAEGRVLEPLAELFKDDVRHLGESLGIPHDILYRHPFPGPGLAVRVPGAITPRKLEILRNADAIFIHELKESGWYDRIWQACTTILPVLTVGVKGDERSYEHCITLRAVISEDAMTADWVEIPYDILRRVSNKILNSVHGVNRVLYDISTKPPASIEWE